MNELSDNAVLLNQRLAYLYEAEDDGFNIETVQKTINSAKNISSKDAEILIGIWKRYLE